MQSPTQPPKQEEQLQAQQRTHKLQHQAQHSTQKQHHVKAQTTEEKSQCKAQHEPPRSSAASPQTSVSEKQPRREEKPQQTHTHQSQQTPKFRSQRSHSSSSSRSQQHHWRSCASPQHCTGPLDNTQETSHRQEKTAPEETHSKRRNRKNKRHKDKTEQLQQERNNDHVNSKEVKQTRQNSDLGQRRETVTVREQDKLSDNPNGVTVTQKAEWISNAGVSEGNIRKKFKAVGEASGTSKNIAGGQGNTNTGNSEECEGRLCSGSGNSVTTSPSRQAPQAMPVTMPPETSSNRRRGKASAQIYRPPPARSSHEEAGSPAHHPHSPSNPRAGTQESLAYHTYPVVGWQRSDSECSTAPNTSDFYSKGRGRRPDQVLYVPRGRRHAPSSTSGSARGTPTPLQDLEPLARPPSPTYSICSVASEYSGRNRYGRQGSQASLFDGEAESRVRGKPPQAKGETSNRETTGGNHRQQKGGTGGSRFSNQTYQLIERCLNQDTDSRGGQDRPAPLEYHKEQGGRKSPAPPRDAHHSVHSKENIMAPQSESGRRAKKRRSRRRHSQSREPSSDHQNRVKAGDQPPRPPTPLDRRAGSCERVFYNSSYERHDRGYDNYDRYSSSRTSSRNPSLERSPHNPNLNWRVGGMGGSNPMSPSKSSPHYCPPCFRTPQGKPPSGRLGSLPNVSLDFGENEGPARNTMENCQTLPAQLPSKEEANTCTSPPTTPSKLQQDNSRLCLDSSLTSNWTEAVALLDNNDADHHSQDVKTPPKEPLYSKARSPLPSREPSPCSSPVCPVEKRSIQGTVDYSDLSQSNTDHTNTHPSHRGTNEHDTDHHSPKPDSSPNEAWDSCETETSGESSEAPQLTGTEEQNSTEDRDEKKASKKFAFNWADEVEDSWDSLYDDSGDCLDPDLKQQLNETLGNVKLEKPVNDYCRFQPRSEAEMNEDDYAHVIEIYDFPTSFKTQDLMMVFGQFHSNGFDIKWVDDTHALGIFSTALMAAEALTLQHPFLKTRTLSMATKSSRAKAMRITDALLPYKPRPATSAALARRLVSGALGLKVNISREVREAERQKLKDAKARKRLEAKQRMDAWEGNLT